MLKITSSLTSKYPSKFMFEKMDDTYLINSPVAHPISNNDRLLF